MEYTIPHKSLRFFPHWDNYNPNQIIGFLNMINYILNKKPVINNWLELGSFIGESANLVLGFSNIEHIDCVDSNPKLMEYASKRLHLYIKNKRCDVHCKTSNDFLQEIPKNFMDVVYIDANHEYDFIKNDIELSFSKLQNDGFLCGHDYNIEQNTFPGCIKAIQEFSNKQGLKITRFIDNSWIMTKE